MSEKTDTPSIQFKRFSVKKQLGAGGMGVVYLATDRETGQDVALKTLKAVDATAIFKFKQEFRSLSELVHKNLIRMHELFCEDDQWFFVMELIDGAVEFQDYLLSEPLKSAEVLPKTISTFDEQQVGGGTLLAGAQSASAIPETSNRISKVVDSGISKVAESGSVTATSPTITLDHSSDYENSDGQSPSTPDGVDQKTVELESQDTTVQEQSSLSDATSRTVDVNGTPIQGTTQQTVLLEQTGYWSPDTVKIDASGESISPISSSSDVDDGTQETIVGNPASDPMAQTFVGHVVNVAENVGAKTSSLESIGSKNASPKGSLAVRNMARLRDAFRQLVSGIRGLHRAGMLHRDLKPANALVSRSGTVVLLDFGLVAELSASKRNHGSDSREISGTIAYMSPEQARASQLTEASDWYAVGVMLFQALTGKLPFSGKALQVLSRKQLEDAPAPSDIVDGVPSDLDEMCIRLLNRDPGLRPTGLEIAAFFGADEPHEGSSVLQNTQLFVGRERQLAELDAAFQTVLAGRTVIARVHGRSGAGKSVLIQHFLDDLIERHQAIVLSGRCYEQESVPYKGVDSLIDAVTQFLRSTSLPVGSLLPSHITALARIFPVLNRIKAIEALGKSQLVTTDLRELRRNGFEALRELLSRIGRERPLVVYLDDLQWGDIDSAALLADLISGEFPPRMLLIAAYRSEYVDSSVCLKSLLETERASVNRPSTTRKVEYELSNPDDGLSSSDMSFDSTSTSITPGNSKQRRDGSSSARFRVTASSGVEWKEIVVTALSAEETRHLAKSLLRSDLPNIDASADQIVSQSGGSAYFVHELARHLNSGLDLNSIAGVGLDEVLWENVRRLPDEAQQLLQLIAISGQPTPLKNILEAARINSISPRILATLRTERFLRSSGPGLLAEVEAFHDRIRESISNHLDNGLKKEYHGRLADSFERSEGIAPETIAGHLEAAEQSEKAGRYYSQAATMALQKLAFDRAEEFSKHAVRLAQTDDDKVNAHERLIHYYTDMARFPEAYAQGREAAKQFGVSLPAGFVPPLFIIDFLTAKWRLMGRKIEDLVDLPVMQNPRLEKAVRIINAAAKAAYQVRPELCVAVSTKTVNLCLKHGNTPDCAIGWMVFGAIFQGGVMGNHPVGYDYGRLALSILDRYHQEKQRPEVTFVVGYFGTSWMRPATEAEALWKTTYKSGRETGDLFHTGCSCAAMTQSLLMRGVKLSAVWAESDSFMEFLKPLNLHEPIGAIRSVRQLIRNLCGKTQNKSTFSTQTFDEDEYVSGLGQYGSRHFAHFYFVNKMLSQYLWGEFEAALVTSQMSAQYLKESPGMLHSAEHFFLTGLIQAALANSPSRSDRGRLLRGVRSAANRLKKWAARCPHNFEHKSQLLNAELARLGGSQEDASAAYEAAIRAANQFGYRQIEAIAHQQYALLHDSARSVDKAASHRCLARDAFQTWGAMAIARSLS